MESLDEHFNLEDESESSDDSSRNRHKSKLPLASPLCAETKFESGFQKTGRICLEHIREAMLHHKWQEAAEYMASYTQMLEDRKRRSTSKELVWRLSIEILHHLSNSTVKDYNIIYERMKHSGVKDYLTICLEHSFHLMLHGQIEEAKQQLSVAESWRYGKESISQHQRVKLIQAYRSLLDYMIWCDKKYTLTKNNSIESDNQGMQTLFRQASVNFKELLRNPGVWDPFVLSYVEMLEFYEDYEEALNVLNDYAYDNSFPPNPNAHVYIYQFLKRHNASEKKLVKVLKNLHLLVPSHELMLEYSFLLLQSERTSDFRKAFAVLLDMLDFACWRSNLDVWKSLQDAIHQLLSQNEGQMIIQDYMALRKDWWPKLHFTRSHAKKDSEENAKLLEVKASLAEILCPGRALRYTAEPLPT
ncbi:PREDICTED: TATA box-binding protein-associated factor RNA polymerase I subunit A [Cyprinodon variegatus]|uniref:TATA box binding protein (TBP)-associated factor, RNA polymerase I, A n=1 Tax=Cyprinodon variegatus TaxID=28743 RepID=A0A3Q2DP87_CYPVA|nr:PREDICTED: TATA box-binding protein-associated factor RNA polymerase I subunit A [Cyprinodon variegatus]XP_015243482.1 PREDICTED: TATA box-binding protein-associated factor RNA polymerase I subunit A [Cyprinodon variegatus]